MTITTVVNAMKFLLGDTQAVAILEGFEAEFATVIDERDAATNRATALESALARSQAYATDLVELIADVREDAADGTLDNPIVVPDPEPVVDPVTEPVVDPVV